MTPEEFAHTADRSFEPFIARHDLQAESESDFARRYQGENAYFQVAWDYKGRRGLDFSLGRRTDDLDDRNGLRTLDVSAAARFKGARFDRVSDYPTILSNEDGLARQFSRITQLLLGYCDDFFSGENQPWAATREMLSKEAVEYTRQFTAE